MTVAELRKLLDGLDSDMLVAVTTTEYNEHFSWTRYMVASEAGKETLTKTTGYGGNEVDYELENKTVFVIN